jgi:hypothetical protein
VSLNRVDSTVGVCPVFVRCQSGSVTDRDGAYMNGQVEIQ